jgi:type IV secretory pathway TraG/TraD family ATPase VirD4
MSQGMLGKAGAILIAAGVLLALAFGFLTEALTQLACGARPTPAHLLAGLSVAATGNTDSYTPPAGCTLPVTAIRVVDVVAVLLIGGLVAGMLVAVRRYRESDRAFITDLRTRPGFATASEIRDHLSAKAVLRRARQLRPDIPKPTPTDVGWRVGRSRGQDVYVSIEDSVALEGPPRSGKGYRVLISAIVDWSGPLITTSTTNDNLTATLHMRTRRGTVHVFDPDRKTLE